MEICAKCGDFMDLVNVIKVKGEIHDDGTRVSKQKGSGRIFRCRTCRHEVPEEPGKEHK